MDGTSFNSSGPSPALQLLAGMQALEELRAKNELARQNLAAQLQKITVQAHARELLAQASAQAKLIEASMPLAVAQAQAQAQVQAQVQAVAQAAAAAPPASAADVSCALVGAASALAGARTPAGAGLLTQGVAGTHGTSTSSTMPAPSSDFRVPDREEAEDEQLPQVPRCHLHRKQNKACKFCKAYYQNEEIRCKRLEEKKNAALEKLKEGASSSLGRGLGQNDKVLLPSMVHFSQVLMERIMKNGYYVTALSSAALQDVKTILFTCETCDVESRGTHTLDLEPSKFIGCVYRILSLQLTEGQLQSLLNNSSCWVRCAAYVYVRLGVQHDRYWELLSDALMDDEEFIPFPGRGGDSMTVGQYVEQLFTKDKYCDLNLPRIPVAHRKVLNRRIVLYEQFRRRYAANLEVFERYEEPGVQVECCSPDGEWTTAETVGTQRLTGRCATVQVRLSDSSEQSVSLGMVICPGRVFNPSNAQDLTRSKGRSSQELLERFEEQQRDSAVAKGKDYCKTSGQHTLRVGGIPFVAGVKRKEAETREGSDDDGRRDKRSGPSVEHQAKLAAIEAKYCARVATQGRAAHQDGVDGPERMRLG